jgi:trigger factor
MKSTAKELERRQTEIRIEVEEEEYTAAMNRAYAQLSKRVEIHGFRKGKAPRHLVEQAIGKENIEDEAIEQMFPSLYEQALETHDLYAATTPKVSLEQRDPPVYAVIVPLQPEVDLGDYKAVRVEEESAEVSDEEVVAAIDRIRESQAVLAPVERALAYGDFAIIDVKASVEETPFLDHQQVTYEMVEGSPMPMPGFADALVGMEKGEVREFTLKMPEDFRTAELAGKDCSCSVTLQEVKVKEAPELTDSLAQTFGFDSVDAMRERVGNDLESNARSKVRNELINKALDAIGAQGKVEFAPVFEEREIDDLLENESKRYGYKEVSDYLKMTNRPLEELREDLRPLAHKRIVNGLIISELGMAEQIDATAEDVDARIEELVAQSVSQGQEQMGGEQATPEAQEAMQQRMREYLNTPEMRESVEHRLRTNRTLDRLVEIVTGVASEAPGKAEAAEDGASPVEEKSDNG